jgi:hypothetical protein
MTILRPAIGVERMADVAPDTPRGEILGCRAEHEDRRIVQREDRVKTNLKQLVHVPQVADDLGRRPRAFGRAQPETLVIDAAHGGGERLRRQREPLEQFLVTHARTRGYIMRCSVTTSSQRPSLNATSRSSPTRAKP